MTTAIPSVLGAAIADSRGTEFKNYHSQPWERIADQLGKVTYDYLPGADSAGSIYWLYTYIIGQILD